MEVSGPEPWTLDPDKLSLHPPEEILDTGFAFETVNEMTTLSDRKRIMEIHHVYGATTRNCRQVVPPLILALGFHHSSTRDAAVGTHV